MHFRTLLAMVALAVAPSAALAQVDWRFENFTNTTRGFTTDLLFRNTQGYGISPILAIRTLQVAAGDRMRERCTVLSCVGFSNFSGLVGEEGAVDRRRFDVPTGSWIYLPDQWRGGDTCGGTPCLARTWDTLFGSGAASGLFGCQLPTPMAAVVYAGRTCAEDGFDGWIRFRIVWDTNRENGTFRYEASDLLVSFGLRSFSGPSILAPVPVPEPSAMMLLGVGLVGLAITRRRMTAK